jgi:hypothetical protein
MPTTIDVLDAASSTVTVATNDAVVAELQSILAKIIAAPATQTTSASILAKIIAAPATEAKQDTLIAKDFATQTTLAALLAKVIAAPATEAKQDTLIATDFATQTTLAAVLAKIIAAPATEAKQDTMITGIQRFSQAVEGESVAASQTNQSLGATGGSGDYFSHLTIIPATTSPGVVTIKDGSLTAYTIFTGGASSVTSLVPFTVPVGETSTDGAWQITTGANVSVRAAGNFT